MTLQLDSRFDVTSESELAALFDSPKQASLAKELDRVDANYARWIAAARFFVLCTAGPGGLDTSPRGDPRGFVRVHGPQTLLWPERRGNNRSSLPTPGKILGDATQGQIDGDVYDRELPGRIASRLY